MKQLVKKEFTFTALPLCYLFLLFSGMTMIPGYPIAMGSFFLCLSLFQSMMNSREQNDLSYTLLLPVSKADVVKANYLLCVGMQLLFFLLTFILLHQQAQRTQAALAGKQHIFSANTGLREHNQVVQQPRAADIIGQQRNIFLGIQLTVKGIIRVFFNIIDIDLAVFTARLLVAARDLT